MQRTRGLFQGMPLSVIQGIGKRWGMDVYRKMMESCGATQSKNHQHAEQSLRSCVGWHRCHAISICEWQDARASCERATMAYAMKTSGWDTWTEWRQGVVAAIRMDFPEVFQDVGETDIDWDAWRAYYDQGLSPQSAVDQAFLRNVEA